MGQNFLADAGWRARIAETISPRPGDVWVEIGAGHGEMTELLASRASRVIAIELDSRLAERLRNRAKTWPNVEVMEGDFLEFDLAKARVTSSFRVFGNIPYYITSPILHRIFRASIQPREDFQQVLSAHLVIQLEVAERLAAKPGRRTYGYLSVAAQFYSSPKIMLKIPPGAFRPRPKVASALVELRFPGAGASLKIADPSEFLQFVQHCFSQKRKTLANNLRGRPFPAITGAPGIRGEKPGRALSEILAGAGIAPGVRAEQLTLIQFAALYNALITS